MRRTRQQSATGAGTTGTDRGVSDMIAFMLVFATIIVSVALLSTVGLQSMSDYQEGEQLRNAERAMEVLTNNFNDVLRQGGIERRTSGLTLRKGTVTTGTGGTMVKVSVDGTYIGDHLDLERSDGNALDLGTFEYEAGSDTIAYEGGGIVRASDGGSVVIERPRLKCAGDRALVSLVAIDAEDRSIQSGGTVEFEMVSQNRQTYVRDGVSTVSIRVTETAYDGAWKSAFGSGWSTKTMGDGDTQATCTSGSSDMTVVVTIVEADVRY